MSGEESHKKWIPDYIDGWSQKEHSNQDWIGHIWIKKKWGVCC